MIHNTWRLIFLIPNVKWSNTSTGLKLIPLRNRSTFVSLIILCSLHFKHNDNKQSIITKLRAKIEKKYLGWLRYHYISMSSNSQATRLFLYLLDPTLLRAYIVLSYLIPLFPTLRQRQHQRTHTTSSSPYTTPSLPFTHRLKACPSISAYSTRSPELDPSSNAPPRKPSCPAERKS